jgi:hypothetical protein
MNSKSFSGWPMLARVVEISFDILEIFSDRGTPFLGGGELVMVAEVSGSGGGELFFKGGPQVMSGFGTKNLWQNLFRD